MALECEVRARVKEIQTAVLDAKNDQDLVQVLKDIHKFFQFKTCEGNLNESLLDADLESRERSRIFMRNHYTNIAHCLLESISIETVGKLYKADYAKYFLGYFLNGSREDAFLVLTQAIYQSR